MSFAVIGTTAAVATVGQGILNNRAQDKAADAQMASANASLAEQRRQFDEMVKLMSPYTNMSQQNLDSLQRYQGYSEEGINPLFELLGLRGPESQQRQIDMLANGPEMQSLVQQGENALLQNAAATGGLRGGNTQAALAKFRPELLSQLINQRIGRLAPFFDSASGLGQKLASLSQASAAGQAELGQNSATSIGNIYNQKGQIASGEYLGQAKNVGETLGSLTQLFSQYRGQNPVGTTNIGNQFNPNTQNPLAGSNLFGDYSNYMRG